MRIQSFQVFEASNLMDSQEHLKFFNNNVHFESYK